MADPLDIVVFGATGFVGELICDYLATRCAEEPTSWAIAGRDPAKLERLRDRLVAANPMLVGLPIIRAESHDPDSLAAMVARARVVLTTVGPYARYGEPLVAACAEQGRHYVDLTGEPGWWREMIARHHERALGTGAKIVPACGFDSIPFDLGAYFTARQLPDDATKLVRGYLAVNGRPSGGTWSSALTILAEATRRPPRPAGASRPKGPRRRGPHLAEDVGAWAVPLPTIDPLVVRRSAELRGDYGPDFTYHHYLQRGSLPGMLTTIAGAAALAGLARVGPVRRVLAGLRPPGTGPSPERRAKSWFRAKFFGEGGGRRVVTQMRGGDPGYDETAKMVVESALCLAHDEAVLPPSGGVLTPAAAMGMALVDRLAHAGLGLEILEAPA